MTYAPTVTEIVAALNHRTQGELAAGERSLWTGSCISDLLPALIAAYPLIPAAPGRNTILFRLTPYARTHQEIVELAVKALSDSAYLPRMQALAILAYSLRAEFLPNIRPLLDHRDSKTRADAAAAIDAISNQNHHYFLDRKHAGNCFWTVNPSDDPKRYNRADPSAPPNTSLERTRER